METKNLSAAVGHFGRLDVPDRTQRGRLSPQFLWSQHVLTIWVKQRAQVYSQHNFLSGTAKLQSWPDKMLHIMYFIQFDLYAFF